MAFQQQQQRPAAPRQLSAPQHATDAAVTSPRKRTIEESQEWILFSPVQDEEASVSATHTSRTPRTATHLSDFGSLETHVRSQPQNSHDSSGIHIDDVLTEDGEHDVEELDDEYDEENDAEELDSLDDGLHAFHQGHPFSASSNWHLDTSGGPVLPTHDGFGTFPTAVGLQEQLWQFERYNPQRRSSRQGRRRSAQRGADGVEHEQKPDLGQVDAVDDRTARIEQWRLEQSKAVLEEIERETRRLRRRAAHAGSASVVSRGVRTSSSSSQTVASGETVSEEPQGESFWRRITRRVIRDLIGLDENTLSVIFGESFIANHDGGRSDIQSELDKDLAGATPTQPSPLSDAINSRAARDAQSWELRLLETIARELGTLVNQLSEHNNEGAFNTYRRIQEMPIDYAGLNIPRQPSLRSRRQAELRARNDGASEASFLPTVQHAVLTPTTEQGDTSLWGIEEEPDLEQETAERQYWEQEVDIKMIFNYLKSRLTNRPLSPSDLAPKSAPNTTEGPLPASWATTNTAAVAPGTSPESIRRAEVIRRHHPLVSRAAKRDSILRRHHVLQRRAVIGGGLNPGAGAGSSSCASQSTKRSRTGSSRHYWGSASGRGSSGALGGWGEV